MVSVSYETELARLIDHVDTLINRPTATRPQSMEQAVSIVI
jgi:hypothetical protein